MTDLQMLGKSVCKFGLVSTHQRFSATFLPKSAMHRLLSGPTRGEIWTSKNGRPFSHFRSVPYAKPPVGKKRFKLPQPLGSEDR